jgi:hypothetical protein
MAFVVAIDGPAGSGKGTVTKLVGKRTGLVNIDTGAMYRCVTLECLNKDILPEELEKIEIILDKIDIKFQKDGEKELVFLNGENVTEEIRTTRVNTNVAKFAAVKIIRDYGLDFHSVHLPFSCQLWNFSSPDETERKLSVESVKRAVSHYEKDMPNLFVMHPDNRPKDESERAPRMEQLIKSLTEICEFAPRKICLENMTNEGMLYISSEAKIILDAVPSLYMTLDINHPLRQMHYLFAYSLLDTLIS